MNIKTKKTGKIHAPDPIMWVTLCGRFYSMYAHPVEDPLTCKTCIKLEAKKHGE